MVDPSDDRATRLSWLLSALEDVSDTSSYMHLHTRVGKELILDGSATLLPEADAARKSPLLQPAEECIPPGEEVLDLCYPRELRLSIADSDTIVRASMQQTAEDVPDGLSVVRRPTTPQPEHAEYHAGAEGTPGRDQFQFPLVKSAMESSPGRDAAAASRAARFDDTQTRLAQLRANRVASAVKATAARTVALQSAFAARQAARQNALLNASSSEFTLSPLANGTASPRVEAIDDDASAAGQRPTVFGTLDDVASVHLDSSPRLAIPDARITEEWSGRLSGVVLVPLVPPAAPAHASPSSIAPRSQRLDLSADLPESSAAATPDAASSRSNSTTASLSRLSSPAELRSLPSFSRRKMEVASRPGSNEASPHSMYGGGFAAATAGFNVSQASAQPGGTGSPGPDRTRFDPITIRLGGATTEQFDDRRPSAADAAIPQESAVPPASASSSAARRARPSESHALQSLMKRAGIPTL